jgi:hypothetical protein
MEGLMAHQKLWLRKVITFLVPFYGSECCMLIKLHIQTIKIACHYFIRKELEDIRKKSEILNITDVKQYQMQLLAYHVAG